MKNYYRYKEVKNILLEIAPSKMKLDDLFAEYLKRTTKLGMAGIVRSTFHRSLQQMVERKMISHDPRKGYYIKSSKKEHESPLYSYFEDYCKLVKTGIIFTLNSTKELNDVIIPDELIDNFTSFKEHYNEMIKENILWEKQHDYFKFKYLEIFYPWTISSNICPNCLETIDLEKSFYDVAIYDDYGLFPFARCHIQCLTNIIEEAEEWDQIQPKIEDDESHSENSVKNDSEKNVKKEKEQPENEINNIANRFDIKKWGVPDHCEYCGLSLDLDELFINPQGDLWVIYDQFKRKSQATMEYLLKLSEELFGDVVTLSRVISLGKKKFDVSIQKLVLINKLPFHPKCGEKYMQNTKKEVNA